MRFGRKQNAVSTFPINFVILLLIGLRNFVQNDQECMPGGARAAWRSMTPSARNLGLQHTLATGVSTALSTSNKETGQQALGPKANLPGVEGSQSTHHTDPCRTLGEKEGRAGMRRGRQAVD